MEWQTILLRIIGMSTGVISLTFFIVKFYLEKRIILSVSDKQTKIENQRKAFDRYLYLLSLQVARKASNFPGWDVDFALAAKDILIWCPTSVLIHLTKYAESVESKKEDKSHLANAIIEFRKSIGHGSWKFWNKLDEESVQILYRAGNPE